MSVQYAPLQLACSELFDSPCHSGPDNDMVSKLAYIQGAILGSCFQSLSQSGCGGALGHLDGGIVQVCGCALHRLLFSVAQAGRCHL